MEDRQTMAARGGRGKVRGQVMQLQDFSVHDGDGIRTAVFLSGCPLRCRWCANPEGWTAERKLAFFSEKCLGCGRCAEVCPSGLLPASSGYDAGACRLCGACAGKCPAGALQIMGQELCVADVARQVERDSLFYGRSGGA